MAKAIFRTYLQAALLSCLMIGTSASQAANVPCEVGSKVEGDIGGGETGEIIEIGTVKPHKGWYLIAFSYSPKGDWYNPKTVEIHPEGSDDRCTIKKGSGPASSKTPAQTPSPEQSPASSPAQAP